MEVTVDDDDKRSSHSAVSVTGGEVGWGAREVNEGGAGRKARGSFLLL
jgi:hypothetical protein